MSPLPASHNTESIEWITGNASALVGDQQRRAESLQTRAGQVAGFAGATVALGAPIGRKALRELSGTLENITAVCYFGGALALAGAIVISVVFVLRPVQHLAIGAAEIDNYVTDERFIVQTPAEIQFRTLKALKKAAERYETVNATKATCLKIAAVLFLVGLLLTVGVAVTLAGDAAWD